MNTSRLGLALMHLLAELAAARAARHRLGRCAACCLSWPPPGARLRCAIWSCAFPRCPLPQRRAWAKETFVVFCQTFIDRSWLWFGSEALVRSRVQLTGALHELEGDTATIVFAPHFYSMDAGGLALPLNTPREFTSIFATNPDPVLDAWFMAGRQRFGKVRMLNRADGVKPIIQVPAQRWLAVPAAGHQDYGPSDSVFVPFFAVPDAATIPSLSRFARLGKAKVVALYSRMTPQGYAGRTDPRMGQLPHRRPCRPTPPA